MKIVELLYPAWKDATADLPVFYAVETDGFSAAAGLGDVAIFVLISEPTEVADFIATIQPVSTLVESRDLAVSSAINQATQGGFDGYSRHRVLSAEKATWMASGFVNTPLLGGASASLAYLFHPSAEETKVEITRILVSYAGVVTGRFRVQGAYISAEAVTPGGTLVTPRAKDGDDGASGLIFRYGAADPTREATDVLTYTAMGVASDKFLYAAGVDSAKPFILRPGVGEGLELRVVVDTILAAATQIAVTMEWTEELISQK